MTTEITVNMPYDQNDHTYSNLEITGDFEYTLTIPCMPLIEYFGVEVITPTMIDAALGIDKGISRSVFEQYKEVFLLQGIHYFEISPPNDHHFHYPGVFTDDPIQYLLTKKGFILFRFWLNIRDDNIFCQIIEDKYFTKRCECYKEAVKDAN